MTQIERSVLISNERGLHARASAKFVETAIRFDARVQVCKDHDCVEASSIMDVLMLAATKGTQIRILADGPQAQDAVDALVRLVEDQFYENEFLD